MRIYLCFTAVFFHSHPTPTAALPISLQLHCPRPSLLFCPPCSYSLSPLGSFLSLFYNPLHSLLYPILLPSSLLFPVPFSFFSLWIPLFLPTLLCTTPPLLCCRLCQRNTLRAAIHHPHLPCRRQDCSCGPHLQTAAPAGKIRHQSILAANFLFKNLTLFHIKDWQFMSACKPPGARNVFIEGLMEGRVCSFFSP